SCQINLGLTACRSLRIVYFFFQEEDGIRDFHVTGVQTCALPIYRVEKNIEDAVRVGIEIARLGAMPVIPHANTADPWFARVQPYEFWCAGTLELMRGCDAAVMVGGWKRSRGARAEDEEANARGTPGFVTLQELSAWLG